MCAPRCRPSRASVSISCGAAGERSTMSAARRQRGSCGSGMKVAESSARCSSSITSLIRSAVRSGVLSLVEQRQNRLMQQRGDLHHEFGFEARAAPFALQPGEVEIERAHLDVGEHVDGMVETGRHPHRAIRRHQPAPLRRRHLHGARAPHRPAAPRGADAGRAARPSCSDWRPGARRRRSSGGGPGWRQVAFRRQSLAASRQDKNL